MNRRVFLFSMPLIIAFLSSCTLGYTRKVLERKPVVTKSKLKKQRKQGIKRMANFTVKGTKIYDPQGKEFIIRGVNANG